MDPLRNPFSPGAGTPPPALVGREGLLQAAEIAIHRIRAGRFEKSQFLLGLRGVGKTVLLNRIGALAEKQDYESILLEAPEGQRLASYLAPALKRVLLRLSRVEQAKDLAGRGMAALRGFAGAFKVSLGDVEVQLEGPPAADSGNLEIDLPELLLEVGKTAKAAGRSLILLIDEVQYLVEEDLRALIVAFHAIAQKGLPMLLFGAGLPQVAGLAGEARSYAERLFEYPTVGPLDEESAQEALRKPIEAEGGAIEEPALARVYHVTHGYPYFLQEWGKHCWLAAAESPITLDDVLRATDTARAALDQSFFRVRFDRLTPREKDYLRAMAEAGSDPQRSGKIAAVYGRKVEHLGPLRSGLIRKGMIWSPLHGETAFTVPLFDEFMIREMPDWERPGR